MVFVSVPPFRPRLRLLVDSRTRHYASFVPTYSYSNRLSSLTENLARLETDIPEGRLSLDFHKAANGPLLQSVEVGPEPFRVGQRRHEGPTFRQNAGVFLVIAGTEVRFRQRASLALPLSGFLFLHSVP